MKPHETLKITRSKCIVVGQCSQIVCILHETSVNPGCLRTGYQWKREATQAAEAVNTSSASECGGGGYWRSLKNDDCTPGAKTDSLLIVGFCLQFFCQASGCNISGSDHQLWVFTHIKVLLDFILRAYPHPKKTSDASNGIWMVFSHPGVMKASMGS